VFRRISAPRLSAALDKAVRRCARAAMRFVTEMSFWLHTRVMFVPSKRLAPTSSSRRDGSRATTRREVIGISSAIAAQSRRIDSKGGFLMSPLIFRSTAATRAATAVSLVAMLLATSAPAFAQAPSLDPVIAVVNGTQIRESDVRLADEEIGRNLITQDKVQRREEVIGMMIDTLLASNAAIKQKIGDEADLQRRMAYARNQGLMNQLLEATSREAATDEAVRKAYDNVVIKTAEPELHLKHIIFRISEADGEAATKPAEERAKAALARLTVGEDFAKVATELSDDPLAKSNGGDFGWRVRAEMAKEYAESAFNLKDGEVSPLIKTSFGYHIVKREEQRTRKPLEFEKVREKVKAMVMRNAQMELITRLRGEAKVERKDNTATAEKPADSHK
jgi:peptidylprolyl isomerase/peptidyl-prolyl cis-trans isomerase C